MVVICDKGHGRLLLAFIMAVHVFFTSNFSGDVEERGSGKGGEGGREGKRDKQAMNIKRERKGENGRGGEVWKEKERDKGKKGGRKRQKRENKKTENIQRE